jgi:hypothetical protein
MATRPSLTGIASGLPLKQSCIYLCRLCLGIRRLSRQKRLALLLHPSNLTETILTMLTFATLRQSPVS